MSDGDSYEVVTASQLRFGDKVLFDSSVYEVTMIDLRTLSGVSIADIEFTLVQEATAPFTKIRKYCRVNHEYRRLKGELKP